MIKKVTPHISQNELLIFERSSPGKKAYQLPALDVPAVDPAEALGAANVRAGDRRLPRSERGGGHPPLSRAFPPGITPSITACTRWAPAP
jgi:hypothetical protein